ncbi:MAG: hypothetical protein M0D57_15140 [Sphingobacteriales bacterium JAD_PAG50586_3]|nr:MAG: hypothetical protein M0D57_15140 [Sphingobacteriales bacterium JAD_PAG50586_3]
MNKIQSKITTKLVVQIFVGLIGLISALISIYVFIIPEKVTKLDYEILANTNVLDINADVSKLDITYDSTSLKTTNQSLRIINIRVVNSGNESILKNYYDDNDPLGIIVKDGKIVEKPEIILTGSDYIKKNLIVKLDSSGTIFFNEIIIEPGDFFNVKLLVLYNKNQTPKIQSTGKIAGIKEIPVTSIEESKEQYSFWKTTFGGNIITQIIRLLAYTLVGFIILGLAISITIGITEYNEKRKRKKLFFNLRIPRNTTIIKWMM